MHTFGNNSPELEHLDSDPVAAKDLLIPTNLNTAAQKAGFAAGRAVKTLRELQSNIGGLSFHEGRLKTKQLAQDKPFHFMAGVASAAFTVGLVLRLWRSTRVH